MYEIKRNTREYLDGVNDFIKVAEQDKTAKGEEDMLCPCKDCMNIRRHKKSEKIKGHLISRGFLPGYTRWIWHGEDLAESSTGAGIRHYEDQTEDVNVGNNPQINCINDDEDVDIDLDMYDNDNLCWKRHTTMPRRT